MSDPKLTTTPLPLPEHFSQAQQSFSLKKRRLPFSSSSPSSLSLTPPPLLAHSLPPRPPPKWVPSVSRVFPQRPPSPWTPLSHSLSQTPPSPSLYDPSRPQSYFNQCFTNLGLLGRGSFGEVYKVLSLQDGQLYAVKRTVQRFRGSEDRQRSLREARNHEILGSHPYILGFRAAWEERARLYIQTELCCASLLMHAEATSLGEAEAWGFLCDLLSALQHLHSQGFAHLDLKPANVFLTRSGRLKLGDFGLMLRLSCGDSGREKSELEEGQEGDPRYMAPELLRGQYSLAADVFSLGVSILELACNIEVPKGGDGWQELRQGNLPTEFTNVLSSELQSVLKMMLAPEPSARATVLQLLTLPAVRRQRLKRQVSLFLLESLLFFFSFCQSVVSFGWRLLSSFRFPFLRVPTPSVPCTPPRDSWERDGDYSTQALSVLHTDTCSLEEELVFLPDAVRLDDSPSFSQRVQSRLSLGSTSTPLPKVSSDSYHGATRTPRHSPVRSWNITTTPNSSSSLNMTRTLMHSLSPSDGPSPNGTHDDPPLVNHSPIPKWIRPDSCPRTAFEPKNLLSMFDETSLEGQT
ncbi:membrane-associated tyrosine- and threonine-specific cdc2-inhibitory kinase [Paramormyrops kingsleyae]|uniref:non-specific serine/threonine protein kinase n=1 Tax=Paramormyrops kingsleyae TaxID=1676925 RepID=A0A3B3SZN8_9TELE|nr:membrane-associated tyrosine- and threonine-specific cdc2-inhibitory kinase [Paramormyrops kingsleyae]XP_023646833.1 membrane-associated tyrosine- and threonine-specific cdc2-inhibitory kinase [Paramormyrops kingsleyae]XP_023646834.1 membrane-associated tyrosine- and threonine-specific cdc2-inhibitory kinase [Paramormyrops kingsleyae]